MSASRAPAPTPRGLRRSIVLVGLMGCGKTTVGKALAARLGAPFADADAEIEAAAGMTIPEMFELRGEADFRAGERKVIARLIANGPLVLATGGGAFMAEATRAAVATEGVSVWIRADLDTLHKRTARRTHRPLLRGGDPRAILARLMAARHPVYGLADLTVDSASEGAAGDVAAAILEALASRDRAAPPEARTLNG